MIKPDVIVSQPDSIDFPYWRHEIMRNRDFFGRILVVICKTYHTTSISNFLCLELAKIGADVAVSPRLGSGQDWRNVAVNLCLPQVSSEKILFLEQDFNFNSERFLPTALSQTTKIVGFKEGNEKASRFHPGFLLVDSDLVRRTSKSFGVVPDQCDHFGLFSKEIEALEVPTYLEDIGLATPTDWEHLAGLTSNYLLVMSAQKPNHNVERFAKYNQICLELAVEQSTIFRNYIKLAAGIKKS